MAKMKKNMVMMFLVCVLGGLMTGCSNQIPDMTEQQNALITEYAAGLLLKYHADYDSRLVDTSVPPQENPVVEIPEMIVSDNEVQEDVEETVTSEGTEEPEKAAMSIAQVLGVTGVDINYRGYEVCDSYPSDEPSSDELFFAMRAGAGNTLLVLSMEIMNISGQEMELDTLSMTELDCKILMNENETQRAYVSMLENDFMAIRRTFAPGEVYEAVIITEMPEEKAQAVNSVRLQLKNEGREVTIDATE